MVAPSSGTPPRAAHPPGMAIDREHAAAVRHELGEVRRLRPRRRPDVGDRLARRRIEGVADEDRGLVLHRAPAGLERRERARIARPGHAESLRRPGPGSTPAPAARRAAISAAAVACSVFTRRTSGGGSFSARASASASASPARAIQRRRSQLGAEARSACVSTGSPPAPRGPARPGKPGQRPEDRVDELGTREDGGASPARPLRGRRPGPARGRGRRAGRLRSGGAPGATAAAPPSAGGRPGRGASRASAASEGCRRPPR